MGHEEGWAEVWQLLGRWLGPNFDHANNQRGWDDIHPASPRAFWHVAKAFLKDCKLKFEPKTLPVGGAWGLISLHSGSD